MSLSLLIIYLYKRKDDDLVGKPNIVDKIFIHEVIPRLRICGRLCVKQDQDVKNH